MREIVVSLAFSYPLMFRHRIGKREINMQGHAYSISLERT